MKITTATTSEAQIIETRVLAAETPESLLSEVNEYINNRPAKLSEINKVNNLYYMEVNILATPILVKYEYDYPFMQPWQPISPIYVVPLPTTTEPIHWYNMNTSPNTGEATK